MNKIGQSNNILNLPTTLLAIVAHEDDEVIGTGGTLAKNSRLGGNSNVICFGGFTDIRTEEFNTSCKILGIDYFELLNKNIGCYDRGRAKTADYLKRKIIDLRPEFIITHGATLELPPNIADYHYDHHVVAELSFQAARKAGSPIDNWLVKGLLGTETHALHPSPHVFVDISSDYDKAQEALSAHDSQLKKLSDNYYSAWYDKRTSLRGLQSGVERAEAFYFTPLPLVSAFGRHNISN